MVNSYFRGFVIQAVETTEYTTKINETKHARKQFKIILLSDVPRVCTNKQLLTHYILYIIIPAELRATVTCFTCLR